MSNVACDERMNGRPSTKRKLIQRTTLFLFLFLCAGAGAGRGSPGLRRSTAEGYKTPNHREKNICEQKTGS